MRGMGLRNEAEILISDKHSANPPTADGIVYYNTVEKPVVINSEEYDQVNDNVFKSAKNEPLSTFSIDVDTASYSNVRRFLNDNMMPPADAVRIEELVNYFPYDYAGPKDDRPFAVHAEICACPWESRHQLMRIGIKGKEMATEELPDSNLVFLLDVSGSMSDYNKLPLLKKAFGMLVDQLGPRDRVAIVVYAGNSGVVLESTTCNARNRRKIIGALDRLNAGGSTNGGAGIQLAYNIASENFIEDGINRVILATDGDFNVGVTARDDLISLIEKKAKSGVFLTVLGFGMGNYKDGTAEQLADKGNGNYGYIDSILEAKKLLVEQRNGTLVTIAKDVKIQVEFNPAKVAGYRLIGYENRMLNKEDFNDDKKDAGEIGAGHTVTALYELVPVGVKVPAGVDKLKYQTNVETEVSDAAKMSNELLTVKLRYKAPDGAKSELISFPVSQQDRSFTQCSEDFKFACSVAGFGMLLRDSKYSGDLEYEDVLKMAKAGKGDDDAGYRAEFIKLVEMAEALDRE
ncbi:MAG: VWA domain-containing protein [Phycisphaerae bacterium]|nr:VWA domain-containing protein [Phycisphaerae bacterium]